MDIYQQFIHQSRYARYLDDKKRRETWPETVDRYVNYLRSKVSLDASVFEEIRSGILNMEVMPSMRALMTAGPALDKENVAGFNCAYVAVNHVRAFDEAMYILMCGTGVGFSVERQEIAKLPVIAEEFEKSHTIIAVEDSRKGWAKAFRELLAMLWAGQVPSWDVSKVRPAGARLKTFGGRASGPGPLVDLFNFSVSLFQKAAGRKLTSIECHDLMCKVAEVVVAGGVRRSAMISLSNLSDDRMCDAKSGMWWESEPQRALANNSAVYTEKPDMSTFIEEWTALYKSKSGERGIFNREASKKKVAENERRDLGYDFGTNPCSEIILRSAQFCNLSEVVCREDDTFEDLKSKIRLATIIGTIQSTFTDFKYLRKTWKENTEEERLLGVSLTGIMDCKFLRECDEYSLKELRDYAIGINKSYAIALGINPSTAITCVKPSGTVSALTNSSSGIHARHSAYYIRTVRGDVKDPLSRFMSDKGVPCEPCVVKPETTVVFSFPHKSPEGAITRNDMTAVEQLEFWLKFQRGWCEHKPSVTISVREHEWLEVGAWVYRHFDEMSGISFLPYSEHIYQQAPYQECSKGEYEELAAKMPKDIDWTEMSAYESGDNTKGSQTYACSAGVCEIVDLV